MTSGAGTSGASAVVPGDPDAEPPVPMPGDLGIVVVSFNTREMLDRCLANLGTELDRLGLTPDHRTVSVVVVDNGSQDGTPDFVRRRHPWVHLVAGDRNIGFTAANNLALRPWSSAEGPRWILLLNPDAWPMPGSLGRLLETARDAPRAAALGPRLRYPDGRFQHAAFRFPGIIQTLLELWPVPRLADHPINGRYARRVYDAGRPFPVDFILGACMLLRGTALRAIGPLDESFFMYCEEIDWCRRAAAHGWEVLLEPRAEFVHVGGASSSQFHGRSFRALWRSRLRYFEKHESTLRRSLLRGMIAWGLRRRRWRLGRSNDGPRGGGEAERAAIDDLLREIADRSDDGRRASA